MAGTAYQELMHKQAALIFKAKRGSVWVGPETADAITALTDTTDKLLKALPVDYEDVGWTSTDGAQFSRDVDSSDITGWGSVEPLRSDITQDTTTLQFAGYETNRTTIGLYTGADMDTVVLAENGELGVEKPADPDAKFYRTLACAVDRNYAGEIYVARFLPRAKVTDYDDQNFQNDDDEPIAWPVTMTSYIDDALGYSEKLFIGGPGWFAVATAAGFTIPTGD